MENSQQLSPVEEQQAHDVIDRVLTYSLDDDARESQMDALGRAMGAVLNRDSFWDSLYVERSREDEEYNGFLRSGTHVLCLSGFIGTGKSTFLLHKLERNPNTDGVLINMKRWEDAFAGIDLPDLNDTVDSLHEILREAVLEHLRSAFRAAIDGELIPLPAGFESVLATTADTVKSFEIDRLIALHSLLHIQSESTNEARRDYDLFPKRLDDGFDDAEYRRKLSDTLADSGNVAKIIERCLKWRDLVDLFRIAVENGKTPLLVFDNVDAAYDAKVADYLVNALMRINNEINRSDLLAQRLGYALPPVKVVFAVRNYTLRRLNEDDWASEKIYRIMLGPGDNTPAAHLFVDLSESYQFLVKIVRRRLDLLHEMVEHTGHLDVLLHLLNGLAAEGEERRIRATVSDIDLLTLNNHSVRLGLIMARDLFIHVVDVYTSRGVSMEALGSPFAHRAFKGALIWSLRGSPDKPRTADVLLSELRTQTRETICPIHRLALTLAASRGGITFQRLCELLELFDCGHAAVQDAVARLMRNEIPTGDLVFLRDDGHPGTVLAENDASARVSITPRGRVFLEHIITHIDYFGSILDHNENVLAAQTPSEAVEYCRGINATLLRVSENEQSVMERWVQPKWADLNPDSDAMRGLRGRLCLGDDPYLVRV